VTGRTNFRCQEDINKTGKATTGSKLHTVYINLNLRETGKTVKYIRRSRDKKTF
jgi:hypothetical protein